MANITTCDFCKKEICKQNNNLKKPNFIVNFFDRFICYIYGTFPLSYYYHEIGSYDVCEICYQKFLKSFEKTKKEIEANK